MRTASLDVRLIGLIVAALAVGPLFANWGGAAGGSVATGTFQALGTGQVEIVTEDLRIRAVSTQSGAGIPHN